MKKYLVPQVKDVGLNSELTFFLHQNNYREEIIKSSILAELEKAGLPVGEWKIDLI